MKKRGRPLRDRIESPYKDVSIRLNEKSIKILKQIQKNINGKYLNEAVNHVMDNVLTINDAMNNFNFTENIKIGIELSHFWAIIEIISEKLNFKYQETENNITINRNGRLFFMSLFGIPVEIDQGRFTYPLCYLHFDGFKKPLDEDDIDEWNHEHLSNNIFEIRNNEYIYYKVFCFCGIWPEDQLMEELELFFDFSDQLIEQFGE